MYKVAVVYNLQVGDIVTVTAMNVSGQWEGEVNGRQGFFPFNYIEFINEDEETDNQSQTVVLLSCILTCAVFEQERCTYVFVCVCYIMGFGQN